MKCSIRSGFSEWMKKNKKGPKCQDLALSGYGFRASIGDLACTQIGLSATRIQKKGLPLFFQGQPLILTLQSVGECAYASTACSTGGAGAAAATPSTEMKERFARPRLKVTTPSMSA